MSIKISIVEKKVFETVNQYNIDEYYINESYGSIERFNQIVNGETLKNNEKPLVDFLGEIRPNNQARIISEIIMTLKLGWVFRIQSIRDSILNNLAPESLWYSPDAMLQNITGQPSISLPTYWTSDNLPLGVQFASRYADEETLISLAAQLEEISPWINKTPNL